MRLRDEQYAGEHTNARKRTVVIPEYRTMFYPVGFVDKAINLFLTSAFYNGYYLAPLEEAPMSVSILMTTSCFVPVRSCPQAMCGMPIHRRNRC
ncbi:MAG: hypothetical protein ACLUDG_03280 [Butyricicoccus sp.]